MDRKRLQKILGFNADNEKEIKKDCNLFYSLLDRDYSFVIPDIQALARSVFMKKGYLFVHIPLVETEIGAYQLKLNGRKYLVVNTSKSLANNNFSVAHELYHLLIQPEGPGDGEEVYVETYENNPDEMMANAFAGNILMPYEDFVATAESLKKNVNSFLKNKEGFVHEMAVILGLMVYYRTTYMSVVIRCFETGLLDNNEDELVNFILEHNDENAIKDVFDNLAGKMGADLIMKPTGEDDYRFLLKEAKEKADKYLKEGILTEEDFLYRLDGLEKAYRSIKREV